MGKLKSKWRKFRPFMVLLLAITGVGAPVATVLVTATDQVVEVVDDGN